MHVNTKIKILEKILEKQNQHSAEGILNNWPELADILIKEYIENNIKNF
jgi:hypothetical protein